MTHRIITNPVRLTGSVHPQQLAAFVAIDSLIRHCANGDTEIPIWEVSSLAGDVAVQRATQEAIDFEGGVRADLAPEELNARARKLEIQAERDLQLMFDEMAIAADVSKWSAASEDAARTARIAFVRLYESGLLRATDAVLDACPTCETVIDSAEADEIQTEGDVYRVALFLSDGASLVLNITQPELLVGAVAVAVPAHMTLADTDIHIPVRDARVPIVAVKDLEQPVLVVPGHDHWSYELARILELPFVQVLDGEGIVRHPGSLEGLGRDSARIVALGQLQAEGRIVAKARGPQFVRQCHRCESVLVPLLGRHWILPLGELVKPVLDAVRQGSIAFSPPFGIEAFFDAAERTGDWAISQQLWSGVPIPVATCLDCNQTQVSVEAQDSCGACMGSLEFHSDVIDGRFVAAITPLAMMGWPQSLDASESMITTLLVGLVGLEAWAIPVAALGLSLAGVLPYQQVVIQQHNLPEAGPTPTIEFTRFCREQGSDLARASLLSGSTDTARHQVGLFANPPVGTHDLTSLLEPFDKAVRSLDAGQALALIAGAVQDGIPIDQHDAARRVVAPILGRSGF